MKKMIASLMIALTLAGCSQTINDPTRAYEPYGLLNEEKRNENVCYETNVGDVILGIILVETIIAPVYIFGFDVKEPKRMKTSEDDKCN
jgi:hypothetical protein